MRECRSRYHHDHHGRHRPRFHNDIDTGVDNDNSFYGFHDDNNNEEGNTSESPVSQKHHQHDRG